MESDREPLGLSRPVPPEITRCLRAANPGFQSGEAGYLENCQRCVAAPQGSIRPTPKTVGQPSRPVRRVRGSGRDSTRGRAMTA